MRKNLLVIVFAILVMFPVQQATAALVNPSISAWLPSWDYEKGMKSIRQYPTLFSEISPFWYYLNTDGTVGVSTGGENAEFVKEMHGLGIKVIPSITNSFKDERASFVMGDETKRKAFVEKMVGIVNKQNYDGLDIDFEGLKLPNKQNFISLLSLLATELHKHNKFLTVAVQAKTSDPGPWETVQAQDWKAIAAVVDRFRIMAYDEHYSGSVTPGAIASKPWLEAIMNFAKTQVPEEKLIVGMPMYGYNWGSVEKTYAVTFDDVNYLLKKFAPNIQWDELNKVPFFTYDKPGTAADAPVDKRTVYFENQDSIEAKWNVVKQYPFSGLVFWRLGGEDTTIWQFLAEEKKKLLVSKPFSDVNEEHWAHTYIRALRNYDLVQGVDNVFFPERNLTRAEGLKIVLKAGQIPATTLPVVSQFTDVKKQDWFASLVLTARARGIVTGQDNQFSPHRALTRSEALKMIQRSFGKKAPALLVRPDDVISRAEFAKLVSVGFRLL